MFVGVCLATLSVSVQADTLINDFMTPYDYVANGVIGDTNWDGVYLRFGDVAFGDAGGNGNGNTATANSGITYPGYLGLSSSGTDWAGAGDDGVFLWKYVPGDFDVSVQSSPYNLSGGLSFDNTAYHMAGLMARAYNPDNSGSPYSSTVTNLAENYVMLLRFQEFGINEINEAIDGTRVEHTFPDGTSAEDLAAPRYFRIVRSSLTNFTFFWKTNQFDSWEQITANLPGGILVRSDLSGPMQVGIAQAAFATANRDAVFTDFQLSGVTLPELPTAAPSSIAFSPVDSTSVRVTWNRDGGDGSLVVVRANGNIVAQPIQGITYTADADFQATNNFLGAGSSKVVYVGAANDFVVTGLGGSNNTYTVGVFTYTGSGSSILYNTVNPATNSTIGPGRVAEVSFTVSPTNIPVGGVAVARVTATYDSGDSYDVSADTSTAWNSDDPTKIIAINGTLTAVDVGSALVSATYAGVTGSATVSTHAPAFVEEFDSDHDYLLNGVAGSKWDGVYLGAGDVPLQISGNLGAQPGQTLVCDANTSSANMLTVRHRQTGWEGNENDGFFLFKRVQSDFQVAVHIYSYTNLAFQFPGLMARQATPAGGPAGTTSSSYPNGRENHVRWMRFDEFGIGASARRNRNGGNQVYDVTDGDTTAFWLLMVRSGTTFTFFKRVNPTDPWIAIPAATRTLDSATNGALLQVGVQSSTFDCGTATNREVIFEHFMLDATGLSIAPPETAGPTNLTFTADPATGFMTLSWDPAAGSDGTMVVLRPAKNVNQQPLQGVTYVADANFGFGSDLGSSNYVVYVGSGSTVTVSNLFPGVTYYAALYAYAGSGDATSFNVLNPLLGSELALGAVESIQLSLAGGDQIPNGGVAFPRVIAHYSTGQEQDASAVAEFSWDPMDALAQTDAVLTGLSNSPVTIQAVYGGKTNTIAATVRAPSYTENFSVNHDYLANGVSGTIWDGVYFGFATLFPDNSVPNGAMGVGGAGTTSICDANISSNNVLTVETSGGDWEFDGDDGFFLFKYVPSDFQVAVHLQTFQNIPNQNSGVMGRAYSAVGAPASTNGESYLSWSRFDNYGIQTDGRSTLDNATMRMENRDGSTNMWLLLVRQNETNFYFLERETEAEPWLQRFSIVRTDLAGQAMQAGVQTAMFSTDYGQVQFDHFMLEARTSPLNISRADNDVVLSWVGAGTLQSSSTVSSGVQWNPVGGVVSIDGTNSVSVPIGGEKLFFRLAY